LKNVDDDDDDDDDMYRFYSRRGVVSLCVCPELMVDLEVNVAIGIIADVRGPQLGEYLTHRADGVCHCVISDGFLVGGNASGAVPLSKNLDYWDGAIALTEERINIVLEAKLFPEDPMNIRCFGAFISNASLDIFLDKAEISAERVSLRSWHSCQGIVWGGVELKYDKNSVSDKCNLREQQSAII
jgi:hypothetical protein